MVLQQQLNIVKILIVIAMGMLFYSCQEDYLQVTEPDNNTSFTAEDTIAGLILKVTLNDGSLDDIIDNHSGMSINFPYEVQIRNERITIRSQEDIEYIILHYAQFINAIRIKFPVTVTLNDHSEIVLENRGEFQKIQNQLRKNNDGIKSIDFVYPFDINLYNIQFQKPEFVSVKNDKKLHGLLKNRNETLFEIDYPVFIELFDGVVVKVDNNRELQAEILQAYGNDNDEAEFIEDGSLLNK